LSGLLHQPASILSSPSPSPSLVSQVRCLWGENKMSCHYTCFCGKETQKRLRKRRGVWTSLHNYLTTFGVNNNTGPVRQWQKAETNAIGDPTNDKDRNTLTTVNHLRVHSFLAFISQQNWIPTNQIGAISTCHTFPVNYVCARALQVPAKLDSNQSNWSYIHKSHVSCELCARALPALGFN